MICSCSSGRSSGGGAERVGGWEHGVRAHDKSHLGSSLCRDARSALWQAVASWQWDNFVEAHVPAVRRIVRVNMDETSIRLWQGGKRQLVKVERRVRRRLFLDREERGSLADRRQNASLLAFIADDVDAQARLPLILLLNERHVAAEDAVPLLAAVREHEHIVVLRRRSAWNNVDLMVWIVQELRRRTRNLAPLAQVVFLLDCAPCHTHARVAHVAARNQIILVFLAASMTASLQPLDVYVFSALKRYMCHAYERVVLEREGQRATVECLLSMLLTADEYLFGRSWQHAFRGCGFGARQMQLTAHLRARFQGIVPAEGLGAELLTYEQLCLVWPQRLLVPIGWLFAWASGEDLPTVYPTAAPPPAYSRTETRNMWHGRLRSSSTLGIPSASDASRLDAPAPWLPRSRSAAIAVPPPSPTRSSTPQPGPPSAAPAPPIQPGRAEVCPRSMAAEVHGTTQAPSETAPLTPLAQWTAPPAPRRRPPPMGRPLLLHRAPSRAPPP